MDIAQILALRGVSINNKPQPNRLSSLVDQLGTRVDFADEKRNYATFNSQLVEDIASYREGAISSIEKKLNSSNDEKIVAESLYTLDRMIDKGVKGIDKTYATLSRFNNTQSPTVQVLLAGIYRKTQVPDAFGPLCRMLNETSQKPAPAFFDPSEEIGGAILEYIRNYSSLDLYSKNAK